MRSSYFSRSRFPLPPEPSRPERANDRRTGRASQDALEATRSAANLAGFVIVVGADLACCKRAGPSVAFGQQAVKESEAKRRGRHKVRLEAKVAEASAKQVRVE
jgi:hypothetical protein